MPTKIHSFPIGEIDAVVIADDFDVMSPERFKRAFSRPIDEPLRAAFNQLSAPLFSYNCLYLHTPTHHILIDTGKGHNPSKPENMQAGLKQAGIQPDQIDTLVITHFHIDHIGGLIDADGALIYSRARLVATQDEWEHSMREEFLTTLDEQTASLLRRTLEPYAQAGQLDLCNYGDEIAPGIQFVAMPGHTPGHAGVSIRSGDAHLLHVADTIHFPLQLQYIASGPSADADPELAAQTRRAVISHIAREGITFFAYHFPFPGLGTVTEEAGIFHWHPIESGL